MKYMLHTAGWASVCLCVRAAQKEYNKNGNFHDVLRTTNTALLSVVIYFSEQTYMIHAVFFFRLQ